MGYVLWGLSYDWCDTVAEIGGFARVLRPQFGFQRPFGVNEEQLAAVAVQRDAKAGKLSQQRFSGHGLHRSAIQVLPLWPDRLEGPSTITHHHPPTIHHPPCTTHHPPETNALTWTADFQDLPNVNPAHLPALYTFSISENP